MSDGARTQTNKSGDPASRFLVGILGTLFTLLAICTIVLSKPYFVRAIRGLETARQQRVAVDRTIEKRRLARRPKLQECWIDCEGLEGIRLRDNYGTTWAELLPLSAELESTPPPAYTCVAQVVAEPFATSPIRSPRTELTSPSPVQPVQPPHQPRQRPWTPNPDGLVQLTLFVAMPTPSRPLYSPHTRHLASTSIASTSTPPSQSLTYHDHPSPSTLTSPYIHQSSFTGTNIWQELMLGVTTAPFIPDLRPSLPSPASEAQKPGPS